MLLRFIAAMRIAVQECDAKPLKLKNNCRYPKLFFKEYSFPFYLLVLNVKLFVFRKLVTAPASTTTS